MIDFHAQGSSHFESGRLLEEVLIMQSTRVAEGSPMFTPSAPSSLVDKDVMLSREPSWRTALHLFVIIEVRQCREDEASDLADELYPVFNLHTRHLLPSRKKAGASNCLTR